jgi:dihydrofolate synthase / folylpolyglutamate synthase
MAFDAFAKAGVDVGLIETALGGRLDSTNVVDPISAGVTSIGWDHMEYLGHTLETIAGEKAGIFKPGRPAVIGESNPDIRDLLRERASASGATPLVVAEEILVDDIQVSAEGTHATFEMFGERERLRTPLIGRHQAHNLAFTLALLHAAGPRYRFSLRQAREPLTGVVLPGRFQRVGRFILDVAHNADGVRVLAETLQAVRPARPILGVFCALRDKEWEEMLSILSREVDALVLTHAPTAPANRAWDLEIVHAFVERAGIRATLEPNFEAALASTGLAKTVVVAGSFHTVGDAMALGVVTGA